MSNGLPTLKITKADLNDSGEYIGATDVAGYAGHIEIDANLGWVKFAASVAAKGRIRALAGSSIKAGCGIKAGWGIEAGEGIKAGSSIEAGDGIKAGDGIEAGDGIKAGWGIEAGFSITAKWISVSLRIFVGMCNWRQPTADEMQVRAEVRQGIVALGTVVALTDEGRAA